MARKPQNAGAEAPVGAGPAVSPAATDQAGASPVAPPEAPIDDALEDELARPPEDPGIFAAARFAMGLVGEDLAELPIGGAASELLVAFCREHKDAPPEAAFMHTRARVEGGEDAPAWSDLKPEARFVFLAFVEGLRLADRLLEAERLANVVPEPPPKRAPVPKDATIFETDADDPTIMPGFGAPSSLEIAPATVPGGAGEDQADPAAASAE